MKQSTAASAWHQARRGFDIWRSAGSRGVEQRLVRAAYQRIDGAALDFPLLTEDIADSRRLHLPAPPSRPDRTRRLRVGWVSTPPGLGSGGHTTMFRMVSALEEAGHECTVFLYNRHGGRIADYEATIRRGWPGVRARVADVDEGITGMDACVATSWQTAHVLARRGQDLMRRLYFVQDFEPFFYPRGAEYALAEDSYRFGFRCIAVGHMVAGLLRDTVGVDADVAEFGCDTDVYRIGSDRPRSGVVFYGKPGAARRGFLLGLLALSEMHRRRPDVPIHMVGDADARVPFPVIRHGVRSPEELVALYNQTVAGVALSFTNITLLAGELLACGTVPVVNDSPGARADLESDHVSWAPPTPSGIADELLGVVTTPPDPARVAATASRAGWRPAQAAFVRSLEHETYGG